MAKHPAIIGNLALKQSEESLSSTEPSCEHELHSSTTPLRDMPRALYGVERRQNVFVMHEKRGFDFTGVTARAESQANYYTKVCYGGQEYNNLFSEKDIESIGCADTTSAQDWSTFTDAFCVIPISSYIDAAQQETVEIVLAQVEQLHKHFSSWPGSYNQLLLVGSLDYCRSALKKTFVAHSLREVLEAIISYYNLCEAIHAQYKDVKTALRKTNLQSVQDRFESLQDIISRNGVYPRLGELDLRDAPCDK